MASVKLSSKNQIVVPKEVRQKLKLRKGVRVSVSAIDSESAIILKEPEDPVAALEGLGADIWKVLGGADKYIKQERASWGNR